MYCLQLERLEAVQKPNPRSPRRSTMSLYLQTEVRSHAPPDTVHCILQTLLNAQEGAQLQLCTLPLLDKSCYIPSKTYTYVHVQVEKLALEKWGGQEKLDAERAKRHEKRLDRERAKAGMKTHTLLPSIGCFH